MILVSLLPLGLNAYGKFASAILKLSEHDPINDYGYENDGGMLRKI